MIVGDVAGSAVAYFSRRVRVRVPDRGTFAVLVPGALDLICRSGRAKKIQWGILAWLTVLVTYL
jgi:hypothetical protein